MLRTLVIILLAMSSTHCFSQQDTVLFMNGDIIVGKILSDDGTDLVYEFKKRKKVKKRSTHKSDLFGIVKNGERKVYYAQNSVVGDDLDEQEVLIFMAGQRDAKNNFSLTTVWAGGLSFGTIAGILSRSNFVLVGMPVIVYSLGQYVPIIKIKEKYITNPNHRYNDIYAEGFERAARGKKLTAAIKSSALGTAIGTVIYRTFIR